MAKKNSRKNSRYTGHVRQRNNGTWEGQYWFEGERKSIYGGSEAEARAKLNEIQALIYNGKYILETSESTTYWLVKWLKTYVAPNVRPGTHTSYEGYIRVHIIPFMGHIKLKNLKTEKLQDFFSYLALEGNKRKGQTGGLAPKTIRNIRNMLWSALDKAVDQELINRNPLTGVKLPKVVKPEMRVLDESENKKLIDFCVSYDHPVAKAIIILLLTGIRKGEMLGLPLTRIRLSVPEISLRQTLTRMKHPDKKNAMNYQRIDTWAAKKNKTGIYVGPIKTEEGNRDIPISSKTVTAIKWLMDYQDRLKAEYKGSADFNPHQFLLCNAFGRPLDPKYFEEWFAKIIKLAGVDQTNIHATRHTFATRVLDKTKNLKAVKDLLGHVSIQTTMGYTHTYDETIRRAVSAVDD